MGNGMSEKLKPCVCGATAKMVRGYWGEHEAYYRPYCTKDGCDRMDPEAHRGDTEKQAADAWNSRPSPWISVSERLPGSTDRVLAYCANANGAFIGFYNPGEFWAIYQGSAYEGNVTHWMPLPKSPKE